MLYRPKLATPITLNGDRERVSPLGAEKLLPLLPTLQTEYAQAQVRHRVLLRMGPYVIERTQEHRHYKLASLRRRAFRRPQQLWRIFALSCAWSFVLSRQTGIIYNI